jgi:hypothetical protein
MSALPPTADSNPKMAGDRSPQVSHGFRSLSRDQLTEEMCGK